MQQLAAMDIAQKWLDDLKEKSNFIPLDGKSIRFNTPFVDPFGDEISLLIVSDIDGTYTVTDQGYTLWNLEVRGVNATQKNSTRLKILNSILNSHKVVLTDNNTIEKKANKSVVAQTINDVLECVIKVSDLAFGTRQNTKSMFMQDVIQFIKQNSDSYSYDIGLSVRGKSSLVYDLDFVFHQTLKESKWTKLYTSLNRNIVEMVMGIWLDTEDFREENSAANKISLNIIVPRLDEKSETFVSSLQQHDINVISFSEKNKFKKNLEIVA